MMYSGFQLDIFIRELKSMISSLVVKKTQVAKKYETKESMANAEMYVMVRDGIDDFSSYASFYPDVLIEAGLSPSIIPTYQADKNKIPYNIRESILQLQRKYIIDNYEENNDYYRTLNGLPKVGDNDYVYAPTNIYNVSTTIPLHSLDTNSIGILEKSGILKELIDKYPDKEYLNYLGDKSIDVYKARKALNFEMLYCEITRPDNIYKDFKKFYSNAREYYLNAIYNPDLANSYQYYDNFIGFSILIMAIQRLFSSLFTEGLTRDFYDHQIIRYLFESYSIPYIENMTIEQLKLLAKNLNVFLAYKSTDKVLFDLCEVFGFSDVTIYKYLIVKNHNTSSETGKPIFPKHTIVYSDGTIITEPDYERMYELYFQKVNILTKDINTALINWSDKEDYTSITSGDPTWKDDEELRRKLYTSGINYIESKYLSIEIMFKVTSMIYELNHVFRMIIDNNPQFSKIYVMMPRVSPMPHNLYVMVIFICAFFCRRYNFTGEIPLKPAQVATVYGFNFHTDINQIISDIVDSKYLDDDMIKYLTNFGVATERDVNRIYSNIKRLKDFIVEQMARTKDIHVYQAYRKLYKSILVVEDKKEMYKKNDGTYAETYYDLLLDLDPELAAWIDNYDFTDIKEYEDIMIYILYRLEKVAEEFKYIHGSINPSALYEVIIQLINFFKSYTVEIPHFGVLYLFADKYFNMLKILDDWSAHVVFFREENLKEYNDGNKEILVLSNKEERMKYILELWAYILSRIKSILNIDWSIWEEVKFKLREYLKATLADNISSTSMENDLKDKLPVVFRIVDMVIQIYGTSYLKITDEFDKLIEKNISTVLLQYPDILYHEADMNDYDVIKLSSAIVNKMYLSILSTKYEFINKLTSEILKSVKTAINLIYLDEISLDIDSIGDSYFHFSDDLIRVKATQIEKYSRIYIRDLIADGLSASDNKLTLKDFMNTMRDSISNEMESIIQNQIVIIDRLVSKSANILKQFRMNLRDDLKFERLIRTYSFTTIDDNINYRELESRYNDESNIDDMKLNLVDRFESSDLVPRDRLMWELRARSTLTLVSFYSKISSYLSSDISTIAIINDLLGIEYTKELPPYYLKLRDRNDLFDIMNELNLNLDNMINGMESNIETFINMIPDLALLIDSEPDKLNIREHNDLTIKFMERLITDVINQSLTKIEKDKLKFMIRLIYNDKITHIFNHNININSDILFSSNMNKSMNIDLLDIPNTEINYSDKSKMRLSDSLIVSNSDS